MELRPTTSPTRLLRMSRACLIAIALLTAPAAWTQYAVNYDSLEQALPKERDALKRLEAAWWLSRSPDLQRAERYAPMVIHLADSLLAHGHAGDYDIQTKKGSGLWNWGRAHWGARDPDSTMAWFQKALDLWTAIGNQERIVFANSQMAPKLLDQGRVAEGIALLEKGLKASEAAKDTFFMATNHNGLGSAHLGLGDYGRAIDHYSRSIALFRSWREDEMAFRYLGDALADMGLIHADLQQLDSAITYYRGAAVAYRNGNVPGRAIVPLLDVGDILRARGDTLGWRGALAEARALEHADPPPGDLSMLYAALAEAFRSTHRLDSAAHYDQLAMETAEQSNFVDRKVAAICSLARTQLQRGSPAAALRYLAFPASWEDGASISLRSRMDMAEIRYEAYARMRLPAEALAAHLEYVSLRDSVKSEDGRRKLIYLDLREQQATDSLKAQGERREMQLQHQHAMVAEQHRKRLFMFGGIGVLLVAIGLWNRLQYTRKAKRAIERERDRSESLLLNILPAEVAEELKEKGEAEAKQFDRATILFTDFKGFTEMSEQLSPKELVSELNACFMAFDRIITARGIEKIKTIGDAYMCVGGLPVPRSSSPADVVHAALEMQAFIEARHADRTARHLPTFRMRVGIHSGPVVAGIVGVKKFQYDIWGDTVNTASRMESSGEVGHVNISEATYALVKDASTPLGTPAFTFTPRGKVHAKGKGEMEMYFVRRSSGEA